MNNTQGIIPSWGPEYTVSLEVYINSYPPITAGTVIYHILFRFAAADSYSGTGYGYRIPAIFLRTNSAGENHIQIGKMINGNFREAFKIIQISNHKYYVM